MKGWLSFPPVVELVPRVKLATVGRRAGGKEKGLTDKAKSCAGGAGEIVREMPWSSVGKTCRPLLFEWYGSYHSYILMWIMSLFQAKAMEELFHSTLLTRSVPAAAEWLVLQKRSSYASERCGKEIEGCDLQQWGFFLLEREAELRFVPTL